MLDRTTLLWIGTRHKSAGFAKALQERGYRLLAANDVSAAVQILHNREIQLIVLENDTSCVQGELAAVRLKSAAPRVPILLLCDPLDASTPQAFFVNLILGLKTAPELLLRAIETLLPRKGSRKTGT
ncbi:MAG: hypothetical protein ACM3SW_20140 [Actinomycetota bacterium]